MSEIKDLSRQIYFNDVTCCFKGKSIIPINFIGFKDPLHFYRDIFNGTIELAKTEEDQKQFRVDLNEITRGILKKIRRSNKNNKKYLKCLLIKTKRDQIV